MSLLDFDQDPPITLVRNIKQRMSNPAGMQLTQQVVQPVAVSPSPLSSQIGGRISSISSRQQAEWLSSGFSADAELFTDVGDIYGNFKNGDVVVDDAGIQYRVVGRARRVGKGNIPNYFKYPLQSQAAL